MKTPGILVLGILVVLCFGLLWAINGPGKNVTEPQNQMQAYVNSLSTANHDIDWSTATLLIANQKGKGNTKASKGTTGGTFGRSAFDKILAQPGVVGIRYYFAQTADGSPTIVLVGVNNIGQAMVTGAVEEGAILCPPYCND
jgi:hypothetical protein